MKLVSVEGSGERYRAELPNSGCEFYAVLEASSKNYSDFGEDSLSDFEVKVRNLGQFYNALINEGFDWVFAHIEDRDEIVGIRTALTDAKMFKYLEVFDKVYKLYCTYSENLNRDKKYGISKEKAVEEMKKIEILLYKNKDAEKFLSKANDYCIENYDWV